MAKRPTKPAIQSATITVNGVTRSFGIVMPSGLAAGALAPAIITLHGGEGADARTMQGMCQWTKHGTAPLIEVYPQATAQGWAWRPGNDWADDAAFLAALRNELFAKWRASRVFLAGISAGGGMVQKVALEAPEAFEFYGVVASALEDEMMRQPPWRSYGIPRHMAFIHGEADPYVPAGWADQSVDYFASLEGEQMSAYAPVAGTAKTRVRESGSIKQFMIGGFGHGWPGSTGPADIAASKELRRFFGV